MNFRWYPVIIIWSSFLFKPTSAQTEFPYFRILAPQFLCSGSESSDFVPPSSITIALQTRGGERLTYRVQIFFTLLDGFKSQRHTLSVWRSIRVLEKKIRDMRNEISVKNQIDILNAELIEGVEYTFNIIGIDVVGSESPGQNFTITYRGCTSIGFDQQSGSTRGDISFLLVGSWSIYRNIAFLMQGVIIFCEPTPHYKFVWKMTGLDKGSSKYLNSTSRSLLIPSGVLLPGYSYQVSVEVVGGELVIAKASGTLNVVAREYRIQLVPNDQSIGINRDIIYTVYIEYFDPEHDQLKIIWTCLNQEEVKDQACLSKTSNGNRSVHMIFPKTGSYLVSVSVTINEGVKNDSVIVEVRPDIISSVEFLTFDPFSVVTGSAFSAAVQIKYLIPQCTAEWFLVRSSQFDLQGGFGEMIINDLEENFLSELIEYENNTISYKLFLTVPEGSEGNSTGIIRGKNHFRLIIECPPPINEDMPENTTMENESNIKAYVDLVLNSNDPPSVEELDVQPKNGAALKTLFKFSTGRSIGSPEVYPMRYRFYYVVEDFDVLVGDFYENTVTSVELPGSNAPIGTKYTVCDSRNACRTVKGPEVTTSVEEISDTELDLKLEALKGSMGRRDYEEFFERAVSCIWTIYALDEQGFIKKTKDLVKDLIINQMEEVGGGEIKNDTLSEWRFIADKLDDPELSSKLDKLA